MSDVDAGTWRPDALTVLRGGGSSVMLHHRPDGLPEIVHWGADLGDRAHPTDLLRAGDPALPNSGMDDPWPLTLLPSETDGWSGRPGLSAHRSGSAVFPHFADARASQHESSAGVDGWDVDATDPVAGIDWKCSLQLDEEGVLTLQHSITNTLADVLDVAEVLAVMPLPSTAQEILDLTGRWCRERHPQRIPLQHGGRVRESRRGRTGHDATLLMMAGEQGFSFRHGEVCGVHVAWSGDHVHLVDQLPEGAGRHAAVIGGGELLRPGEVRLSQGESYAAPPVIFARSDQGLDGLSAAIHGHVRRRPSHPDTPRPVTVNSWEAVYFDHEPDRVNALVDTAARIGAERFVLDDGWFTGRRDDSRGLGDWQVDRQVWPQGLRPLADRVHGHGMQMGLWVEPEMVNLDSEVLRAHPHWLLTAESSPAGARAWRRQQVLDLTDPEVFIHILTSLDHVITEAGIDYIKWDHNRDLHEAVDRTGASAVHAQTTAAYRLMTELGTRHPGLEIESCASGGARVDLGVLEHTQRVWSSDCNDPLERQTIQRWTGMLVPPELQGTHVGPGRAHTTGRVTDLSFRCLTALFGHAGIEWDIGALSDPEIDALAGWTRLHHRLRPLLHAGRTVRTDLDDGAWLHGVVSRDLDHAVFAYVRLTTGAQARPGLLRLPGLDPHALYRVRALDPLGASEATLSGHGVRQPPWVTEGVLLPGKALMRHGLSMPVLNPATGLLIEATSVDGASGSA